MQQPNQQSRNVFEWRAAFAELVTKFIEYADHTHPCAGKLHKHDVPVCDMGKSGAQPTVSERARKRATQSKLRAMHHTAPDGTRYYVVYNLTGHTKYMVVLVGDEWRCTCEAGKAHVRCKHIQRVLDREEQRTKSEALQDVHY